EAGIRDFHVTGVQTCALPIFPFADPVVAGRCCDLLTPIDERTGKQQVRQRRGLLRTRRVRVVPSDREADLRATLIGEGRRRLLRAEERRGGEGDEDRCASADE